MPVALSGRLPAGHGLDVLFDDLAEDPTRQHLIVGLVKCTKVTTLASDGTTTAEVRITAIEAVTPDTEEWRDVREVLEWQRNFRTGEVPLPLIE